MAHTSMLAATPGGLLLVLAVLLPVMGMIAIMLVGGRHAERIARICAGGGVVIAVSIAVMVWRTQAALVYIPGGYQPPLGLALRADGLSAAMLVLAALIMAAASLFAGSDYRNPPEGPETRKPLMFWTLLLGLSSSLNLAFVGNDIFNLYVALELLTFSAVPLVCLDGRAETMAAALRYLVFALLGSVLYLLGVTLIYGAYGTLDILQLARIARAEPILWIAIGVMTVGLLAKTALFPLHLWLPPAHAGAPAAASAVLSALVVKGSFFIIVRLWFDVMPGPMNQLGAQILGWLGAAAIIVGSAVALRQARLKLLVAYSTVAQIGYLFFLFPLAGAAIAGPWQSLAWTGGFLQLASHAFAKAAMFMAAGLIGEALGHDRIERLQGIGRALPITLAAFALGGMSLMGLPPSGGFNAKWLMLSASVGEGQWWWMLVIMAGGLFAAGYVFRVLTRAFAAPPGALVLAKPIARTRQFVALALAIGAILLGFLPLEPLGFLQIGRGSALEMMP